jgi:hypothetical protein
MSYEFQASLYRNCREMLRAIAEADLGNSPEEYDAANADQLAADCIEAMGLDQPGESYGEAMPSHMDRHDYSAADLADAFRDVISAAVAEEVE